MKACLIAVLAAVVVATLLQLRAAAANEPLPTLFDNPQGVSTEFRLLDHGRGGLVPAFGDHPIACAIDFTGIVDDCVGHLRSMKPGMKVDARVVPHSMTFEQVWLVASVKVEDGSHFENDGKGLVDAYRSASRHSIVRHDIVRLAGALFLLALYRGTIGRAQARSRGDRGEP